MQQVTTKIKLFIIVIELCHGTSGESGPSHQISGRKVLL